MSSRGTQASQFGLFANQISEQILRLRALTQGDEFDQPRDVVALKRAVMATRLLGGSARVLDVPALQRFLDQLLGWLQTIEERGRALSTTQSLILDSVIDLEEELMKHLDETDQGLDIRAFEDGLKQLQSLMERNVARPGLGSEVPEPEFEEASEEPTAPSVAPSEDADTDPDMVGIVESLGQLVGRIEDLERQFSKAPLSDDSVGQLRDLSERLSQVISRHARVDPARTPRRRVTDEPPGDWPRQDSLLDPLWEQLQERSGQVGRPIRFHVDGSADLMDPGVRETLRQILRHLLDDVCSAYGEAIHAGDRASETLNVSLTIRREEDRLRIELGDDAPRLRTRASLVEADTLTLYPGVRRSRALIQQLRGLLSIEPQEAPDDRFILTLPASLEDRSYLVVKLEERRIAVPWVLVEGEVPTQGLMVEADQVGQSFARHGRNVPLVDLAQFVPSLLPMAEEAEHILVLGSVEKRVGVFCSEVDGRVRCDDLGDPPAGWQDIAYGGLTFSDETVPVLEVDQLLRRRFDAGAQEMEAGTGSLPEPPVDSYVPVDEPVVVEQIAMAAAPTDLRIVLINQSQFRRRELSRALGELGHTVLEFADIESALGSDPADFDLVVTDLRLGQSGKDNFDDLVRGSRRVPVVLTSAVAREQATLLAEKVGADACWLDPYRPVDFQRLLPGLL